MLRNFNPEVRTLVGFVLADMCRNDSQRLWKVVAHSVSEALHPDLKTSRAATCALNAVLGAHLFAVLDVAIDQRMAELQAERGRVLCCENPTVSQLYAFMSVHVCMRARRCLSLSLAPSLSFSLFSLSLSLPLPILPPFPH